MKSVLKRHSVSKETSRKIAASPSFAKMMRSMLLQTSVGLCFEFLSKKPGRKVIVTGNGVDDYEFDFLEPDGTKCENPFFEVENGS